MTIEKEKLIKLYVNRNLTMRQIAKICNVSHKTVAEKLHKFNIPINTDKRKYLKIRNHVFTNLQKEFIVGTVLGDGCITTNKAGTLGRLEISHCDKQLEYLKWKMSIIKPLANWHRKYSYTNKNDIIITSWAFKTLSHKYFAELEKIFYKNRIKFFNSDLCNYITPFSLAIWLMDDGSRKKNAILLHTDCFSREDNKKISDLLKEKLDIVSKITTIKRNDKTYFNLRFNKQNACKLSRLVEPHFLPSMKYKLVF